MKTPPPNYKIQELIQKTGNILDQKGGTIVTRLRNVSVKEEPYIKKYQAQAYDLHIPQPENVSSLNFVSLCTVMSQNLNPGTTTTTTK